MAEISDPTVPIDEQLVANVGKDILLTQDNANCTTGAGEIRIHINYKRNVTGL